MLWMWLLMLQPSQGYKKNIGSMYGLQMKQSYLTVIVGYELEGNVMVGLAVVELGGTCWTPRTLTVG